MHLPVVATLTRFLTQLISETGGLSLDDTLALAEQSPSCGEETKTKFHHAGEVERYQHDVLNRMIDKRLTLVSLPSSNKKLTGALADR